MRIIFLKVVVLFSSIVLAACGGSSSSDSAGGGSLGGDKAPSKVVDLTQTNEGLYLAARFILDTSLYWEHLVGVSLSDDDDDEIKGCLTDTVKPETAQVFGDNLTAYRCAEDINFEGLPTVKGTRIAGVKDDGLSPWLGYHSLSGNSNSTFYTFEFADEDAKFSSKINSELIVKVDNNESQRTYFVDMEQTEVLYSSVDDEVVKLGSSRETPLEVSIKEFTLGEGVDLRGRFGVKGSVMYR